MLDGHSISPLRLRNVRNTNNTGITDVDRAAMKHGKEEAFIQRAISTAAISPPPPGVADVLFSATVTAACTKMDWRSRKHGTQATRVRQSDLAGVTCARQCRSFECAHALCLRTSIIHPNPPHKTGAVRRMLHANKAGYKPASSMHYECAHLSYTCHARAGTWT